MKRFTIAVCTSHYAGLTNAQVLKSTSSKTGQLSHRQTYLAGLHLPTL